MLVPLERTKVKCKLVNRKENTLLSTCSQKEMFTISVTVRDTFVFEMFMTWTLTLRMSHSQMSIWPSKVHMRLRVLAVAIFALFVTVLRVVHIWTSQCSQLELLKLKIKIKGVDDLHDNWHTNLFYQHAYVYQNSSYYRYVCYRRHFVTYVRIYVHTFTIYDSITPFSFVGTV